MSEARTATKPAQAQPKVVRSEDGTRYRLRVKHVPTATERSGDVELELIRASVPVFLWQAVRVVMERQQHLDLIERFALEAASALGWLTSAELADLTGLPQRAVGPLLRRLIAAGVLTAGGPGSYEPTATTSGALAAETISLVEETLQDFAYFPTSDELVVLPDTTSSWQKRLFDRKLSPAMTMPVEAPLRDQLPSAIVNRHLEAGTAHGRPAGLLRAVPPEHPELEEPAGDRCPVFEVAPVLCRYDEEDHQHRVELNFRAQRARKQAGQDAADSFTVTARLTGLSGLIHGWKRLAALVTHPAVLPELWLALAGPAGKLEQAELKKLTIEEIQAPRFAIWLPEAAVLKLPRSTSPLGDEEGIRLEVEEATVLIHLELRPADDAGAALFVLDHAARLLDGDSSPGYEAAVATAARHFRLPSSSDLKPGPKQVRHRMWQLGYYQAVYDLRENDDFGYA
jgi:hypothetical protein